VSDPDFDVAIVGAGAAGLAAARDLDRAGLRTVILEARDRIGGRICTVHDALSPVPVELGAEFIHGQPPETFEIAKQARLAVYDVTGAPGGQEDTDFDRLLKDLEERGARGPDQTFQQFLDSTSYSEETKQNATAYIEGFNAARKEIIGIASLSEDARAADAIDGDQSFRIFNGYDSVILHLACGLDVRLNSIVERIDWTPGSVSIRTQAGENTRARCAIITAPLGVLQAGSIRFHPEPQATLAAARRLEAGHVVRVVLRFANPFWENDTGFIFSNDPIFPTWWTTLPVHSPILTGWSAGPHCDSLLGKSKSQIVEQALAAIERITHCKPTRLEAAYFHDWQSDPFSLGTYSYVPAGALPARRTLAEPVENTLYFCGEATDLTGHSATVHGAIASGRRAAANILQSRRER
jgi:monoamine oxidase